MRTFTRALAVAAVVAAAACGAGPVDDPAPLDHVIFPTGLALHDGRLLVVSSNVDLSYSRDRGGSVLAFSTTDPAGAISAAANIPSFGGRIAVADAAACGLAAPRVLVPSRADGALHQLDIAPDGSLACADRCEVALGGAAAHDPYAVAVACRPAETAGGTPRHRAYVSHLRSTTTGGYISEVDLETGATGSVSVGLLTVPSLAYDAEADRLFFVTQNALVNSTQLGWYDLSPECSILPEAEGDPCAVTFSANLQSLVRGLDLAAIALSNPVAGRPRRIYAAARLYDPDAAASIGFRPANDVGAVLVVFEIADGVEGPELRLVRQVEVGLGASEVAVLPPRPGGVRDVVAVSCLDAGEVWIYDDDAGTVTVIGRDAAGLPLVGRQPYGLAAEARPDGSARLYVGSFGDQFVTPIDLSLVNPLDAAPVTAERLGVPR